ncbi:hypothetical protein PTTG_26689 [Puccinia triticina 1-1 BBBD Race 1]|uniref:DUF6589 domain-containing protein n=1 Tax=Puccinia triticina (isolate 1-1 / race 1 (BBBD)) TaxID=630390 RepID=A0A180GR82_PUCT1|nr:hypothetical protein PTTG_26689 [Puccinia triticina 1-1 BBBD Race 1]
MIICRQSPKAGYFPKGAFYSSNNLNEVFFSEESRAERSKDTTDLMPFLYNLLMIKLARPDGGEDLDDEEEDKNPDPVDLPPLEPPVPPPDEPHVHDVMEIDINILRPSTNPKIRRQKQNEDMAQTICSMVAFGRNRRHNGLQITNGLLFIACRVTERVNKYLNYIGLTCARRTAHLGLASLGEEAEEKIKTRFSNPSSKIFPPSICVDNLDFQQSIHTKSVGRSSTMFHGTWGYIHRLPRLFFDSLNHSELTLTALKTALKKSINLEVQPRHFGPTFASDQHFEATLKSQLTSVFHRYVGTSSNKEQSLKDHPPLVRPVKPDKPNLTMLKLELASDNSSEGIGDFLTGLTEQAGLTKEEFSSRLQVLEGDLGTCMNVASLREL